MVSSLEQISYPTILLCIGDGSHFVVLPLDCIDSMKTLPTIAMAVWSIVLDFIISSLAVSRPMFVHKSVNYVVFYSIVMRKHVCWRIVIVIG